MIHVKLPESVATEPLPFYLAMEEWVAENLPPGNYFFTWQVRPTVIIGRNQSIDTEVNLDYCRQNDIEVYRRRSGGGCVFADMHNIMFSYITPSFQIETTFSGYTSKIASMLCSLGLNAESSGRNDIVVDCRKVSGNAFYHKCNRSIVHGTMLYDTDLAHMAAAITPSRSKMMSKKVQSVESRITTLNRHIDLSLDEFHKYAIDYLTDNSITLNDNQISEIEKLSKPYFEPQWILGRRKGTQIKTQKRIDGVGEFIVTINLSGDKIEYINIEGDFFVVGDLDLLISKLIGRRLMHPEISDALQDIDTTQFIVGLRKSDFIDLIVNGEYL